MTELIPQVAATVTDVGRKYLRFHLVPDVGPVRMRKLLEHFGDPDAVFAASRSELQRVDGIGPKIADSIVEHRDGAAAQVEIDRAAAAGVRIICPADTEFPVPLRHITDPPTCLYLRGTIEPADAVAIAIVGTRKCSHYGREQALRFGEMLARAGFTVVSGLARGVDGHAHRGALNVGGRTLAVLGNGLPAIYPPEHEQLALDMMKSGAVLTESPMNATPTTESFPRRNRLIAGLAIGTLIIEAGKQSGALITARLAIEYNREVFALPGRVDQPELTAGVNKLIRDGAAKLVTSLDDILDELGSMGETMRREAETLQASARKPAADTVEGNGHIEPPDAGVSFSAAESSILKLLAKDVFDVDQLADASALAVAEVTRALTGLELKGRVTRLPGSRFTSRRRR